MAFRTGNPALRANTFDAVVTSEAERPMTVQGAVNKTAALLLLLILAAAWTWRMYYTAGPGAVMPWLWGGLIGGALIAIVTVFKQIWAPVTGPLYALAEGFVLGAISAALEQEYKGIAIQAVGLTFGVLAALLLAYTTRLIRATENFKLGIFAATGAICLFYLVALLLNLFGVSIPYLHGSGPVGILISVAIVIVAALNLVLDFDFIESGAARGAPKYMEWYAAFGLMVTLVWLYLEILRLLAKARK